MSERVPVTEMSQQRLALWLSDCERDHATPLCLVAVGHDAQAGTLHVYRTEDGPSDAALSGLLRLVARQLQAGGGA